MADSVSFKSYLKRDGQDVEVRRFGIDTGAATSYMYLRGKIQAMFPSVQNDQFSVFWQDGEGDYITIDSDEELVVALSACTVQPIKLYVHVKSQQRASGGGNKDAHPGVTCDSCMGQVTGFRYKCITCSDYDLCAACEAAGLHPEHIMIRMPTPLGSGGPGCNPRFFRKFFKHPHKFHKRHGWERGTEEQMGGESAGPGRCPFNRREAGGPSTTGAGAAGVEDMFDFSALMEFINSMRVAPGVSAAAEATASAQTASSSQAQPTQASSSQQAGLGTNTRGQPGARVNAQEYLNDIGRAIATFLDPFGVDVTFDVRTGPETQEPSGASDAQQPCPTAPQQTPPTPPQQTPPTAPQQAPPSAPASVSQNVLASELAEFFNANTTPVAKLTPEQPREDTTTPVRRNSDDWTLLNRESPVRSEAVAMDVDESRGVKPKTPATMYPELPTETPSAPPQTDADRQRIHEAIEKIRAMGFDFEKAVLGELLRRENGDIATVLEMILNGKK